MAARYYLCAVEAVPQGVGDPDEPLDPETGELVLFCHYRASIRRAYHAGKVLGLPPLSYISDIPTDPVTGVPIQAWCLVYVDGSDLSQVDADSANIRLFQGEEGEWTSKSALLFALDGKRTTALTNPAKAAIAKAWRDRGIDEKIVTGDRSLREALRAVGRSNNPNFHEDHFHVMP